MTLLIIIGIVIFLWMILKGNPESSTGNNAGLSDHNRSSRVITPPSNESTQFDIDTFRLSTRASSIKPIYDWIPYGKAINIAGYDIPGGLLYVGKSLERVNRSGLEPALINPKLKVAHEYPDHLGASMRYWPSYSEITPNARAAYLEWLASGKMHPDTYIGYVFLYFYGLERRVLFDLKNASKDSDEIKCIAEEVSRLIKTYGRNRSFSGYASGLLDTISALKADNDDIRDYAVDGYGYGYEIPLGLKLRLGKLAINGKALPADMAYSYIINNPIDAPLRTPARRCPVEFKKLFHIRYTEKYGNGVALKVNKTPLKVNYRPASASFDSGLAISVSDIPDVTVLKQPWQSLIKLAESCTDELDAYSRYLGRYPDSADTAEAQALLPKALLSRELSGELRSLSEHIKSLSGGKTIFPVQLSEIIGSIPSISNKDIGKKEAVSLAQILEKLGYGMEPDVRFYGAPAKMEDMVILFGINDNASSSPSIEYSSAALMLQLAAMVASADGTVSPEEERALESHLESLYHLDEGERVRLKALMTYHLTAKSSLAGNKKRIEKLSPTDRGMISDIIIGIAKADNHIDPAEVKTLEKMFKSLGLDLQALYSALHSAATEPVTVVKPDESAKQYAIPKKPAETKPSLELDRELIAAKMREATMAASLLGTIFTGDEPVHAQPVTQQAHVNEYGMDIESVSFMKKLIKRASWQRAELEELAAKANIMLDGVLESINDACFEKCGEPLFEDGDTIEINESVAKEMIA